MRALAEEFLLWQDRVLVAVVLEGLLVFLAAGALCWFVCHCDCGWCWRRKVGDGVELGAGVRLRWDWRVDPTFSLAATGTPRGTPSRESARRYI